MVNYIATHEEFQQLIKDNPKVVVDFTASWCPPCKRIGPIFEGLEKDFTNIKFVKIDVDANGDTAAAYDVSAMPTFKFIHNGVVDKGLEVVGADEQKLRANLAKFNN